MPRAVSWLKFPTGNFQLRGRWRGGPLFVSVSYHLTGLQLSHQDSMGNKESLGRGAVQYLSAGTGITHSEMNDGAETCRPVCMSDSLCLCRKAQALHALFCRFLQIWILPAKNGETPQYGSQKVHYFCLNFQLGGPDLSAQFSPENRRNTLLQILRGTRPPPQAAGLSIPDCVALKQVLAAF